MLMQKIRRATKKHRKIIMAVVVLLIIGLVGSFAVWNSGSFNSGSDWEDMTYEQRVAAYEEYIPTVEPENITDADYAQATEMAGLYADLYSLGMYASYEIYSSVDAEETEIDPELEKRAVAYSERAMEAALLSAQYYQQSIDKAGEDLSESSLAQLYARKGSMLVAGNDMENAKLAYDKAIELDGSNVNVISGYADYLYNVDGYEAAIEYLNTHMEGMDEESTEYATLSQQLGLYELYASVYNSTEESDNQDANTEGHADDSGSDNASGGAE